MASLYELINAELEKNKSITYNRLDEFITDDKRSAEFIMSPGLMRNRRERNYLIISGFWPL